MDDCQFWSIKHFDCSLLGDISLSAQDCATILCTQRWLLLTDGQAGAEGSLTAPAIPMCIRINLQIGTRWRQMWATSHPLRCPDITLLWFLVASFHWLPLVVSNFDMLWLQCREEPCILGPELLKELSSVELWEANYTDIQEICVIHFTWCLCLSENFFTWLKSIMKLKTTTDW